MSSSPEIASSRSENGVPSLQHGFIKRAPVAGDIVRIVPAAANIRLPQQNLLQRALPPPGSEPHAQGVRLRLCWMSYICPATSALTSVIIRVGNRRSVNTLCDAFAVFVVVDTARRFRACSPACQRRAAAREAHLLRRRRGGANLKTMLQHVVAVVIRPLRHAAREVKFRHKHRPNIQLVQQPQPAQGRTQFVPPQRGIARVGEQNLDELLPPAFGGDVLSFGAFRFAAAQVSSSIAKPNSQAKRTNRSTRSASERRISSGSALVVRMICRSRSASPSRRVGHLAGCRGRHTWR